MSDILRKQILNERNRLMNLNESVNEALATTLIGNDAVRAIKADAERRADAEVKRSGLVVPPWVPTPADEELGLSVAGLAYWTAAREAQASEPPFKHHEPSGSTKRLQKIKLRKPKEIAVIGGQALIKSKLTKRESFIAGLQSLMSMYEQLLASERTKFTTVGAPEIGGARFPYPVVLANAAAAQAAHRKASGEVNSIRLRATRQAWLDGLDKAAGRNTGRYKVSGALRVAKEGSDEK